jgi:hypothetical protein
MKPHGHRFYSFVLNQTQRVKTTCDAIVHNALFWSRVNRLRRFRKALTLIIRCVEHTPRKASLDTEARRERDEGLALIEGGFAIAQGVGDRHVADDDGRLSLCDTAEFEDRHIAHAAQRVLRRKYLGACAYPLQTDAVGGFDAGDEFWRGVARMRAANDGGLPRLTVDLETRRLGLRTHDFRIEVEHATEHAGILRIRPQKVAHERARGRAGEQKRQARIGAQPSARLAQVHDDGVLHRSMGQKRVHHAEEAHRRVMMIAVWAPFIYISYCDESGVCPERGLMTHTHPQISFAGTVKLLFMREKIEY